MNGPEVAAPLDQLLAQASVGAVRRLLPVRSTLRFAAALAGRPRQVAARSATLATELGRIAVGTSTIAPSRGDRRFTDPAWTRSPLLHRTVQAYLAAGAWAEGLVQDASLEWADAERMGFAVSNLIEAASPSNNPLLSPVAWKAAIDTGAANMVIGPRNLLRDLSAPPRVPSMVPPNAYQVGTDLAVTPGSVVLRTPMLEVIQYRRRPKRSAKCPC